MIRLDVRFDYEQIPMHFVLEVPKGQHVAIVGESGAGKSTLLNLIAGFEQPTSGQIWLNNCNHTATQVAERPVSMLFQDNNVFPHLTVEQNIGLALIPSLKLNSDQKAQVKQIAEQMGIADLLHRRADQLSGGQKRRVAIAGVLAMEPDILVLDEPTAGLDPKGRDEILGQISHLQKETGISVVLVSHSMEDVANYVERIIVMNKGKVMFDDVPHRVFSHVKELEAVGLAAPQVTYILHQLKDNGFDVDPSATTIEEAKETILQAVRKNSK